LRLSPPAAAAPLEDPVSMLDQPKLTPKLGSIFENKYPTRHWAQRKGSLVPTFGKNYPTKNGFPLLTPHHTPISHQPRCPMPQPAYRPPSRYCHAAPAAPVTEESDLHVQQVPWEGRDVRPSRPLLFPHQVTLSPPLKSHVTPVPVTCRLDRRDPPPCSLVFYAS